ncbi:serine/threonine-protein phosphatase [Nocardioides sp. BGMRC 2183]|nr:serine/threonine-protein phosphatase [Nocardioides sp. BGMRC 2183]
MTTVCAACGAAAAGTARFCEGCGAPLAGAPAAPAVPPTRPGSDDPLSDAPISAPTRRPSAALPDPLPAMTRRPCAECGGEVGPDLYCLECGTKAPSERDHFRESPAPWVAGVCDRGITHARNEDAMALLAGARPGSRAVLVVLDGVSNSIDSDVASLAGAHAAREVLRMPLPAGLGTEESRAAAAARVFDTTVQAANTAIVATTDPDSPNPASATFAVAVVEGDRVHVANIGDSRAYWLPDDGQGVQLSTDDSMAQAQIAAGVPREIAETSPQAHAITKWLGRDSPDLSPHLVTRELSVAGWVLVCSDGLWNYASEPADLTAQIAAAGTTDPAELALALVGFANDCGGQDNITVALARVDPTGSAATTPGAPAASGLGTVGQNADQTEQSGGGPTDPEIDVPDRSDVHELSDLPDHAQEGPSDG